MINELLEKWKEFEKKCKEMEGKEHKSIDIPLPEELKKYNIAFHAIWHLGRYNGYVEYDPSIEDIIFSAKNYWGGITYPCNEEPPGEDNLPRNYPKMHKTNRVVGWDHYHGEDPEPLQVVDNLEQVRNECSMLAIEYLMLIKEKEKNESA